MEDRPKHALTLFVTLLMLTALAGGCASDSGNAAEADASATPSAPSDAPSDAPVGVEVSGQGWSASFPGEPETSVEETPLPEVGITLRTDVTAWESSNEALAVMVGDIPADAGSSTLAEDMRQQLFATAASRGTIVEDAPVLDSDGSFRGRDAVVVTDASGEVNALMFIDGITMYQVVSVTRPSDGGARLASFLEGMVLDG